MSKLAKFMGIIGGIAFALALFSIPTLFGMLIYNPQWNIIFRTFVIVLATLELLALIYACCGSVLETLEEDKEDTKE